jgi:hypothetical protein
MAWLTSLYALKSCLQCWSSLLHRDTVPTMLQDAAGVLIRDRGVRRNHRLDEGKADSGLGFP